jgi:RHS repeat-associated protein
MKYDLRDRVHEQTEVFANAQGTQRTTTRTRFDTVGNAIEVIDAASRSTTHTYDARNRLTSSTDALNGITRYAYDDRDNLLSLTDANENTHRFTYDRLNRTKTEARPLGQTHRYDYDAAGNLTRKTDARNQVADYHYDAAGRRASIEYTRAGEASPHKTVTFTYNARNVLTGYADGITSGSYVYDPLQRKTSESVDYGDFVWTYGYTYAANSQKTSYTAIDGTTFSYGYDAAKNLSSIVIPNEGTIEYGDYRWTRPGRVTYPGGTIRTLTYDGLLRSERILVQNAASEVLMDYRYQYDAVGNIREKTTEHGPYRYEYDRVDRLTVADYPNGPQNDQINESMAPNTFPFADDRYTYDLLGNRLTDERQTQAFQWQYNRNNELLHSGFATYEYNDSGSTTAKKDPGTGQPIQSYRYNSEERMDEVRDSEGNLIAEYYYDPFGRLLFVGSTGAQQDPVAHTDEGMVGTEQELDLFVPTEAWGVGLELRRISGKYNYLLASSAAERNATIDSVGTVSAERSGVFSPPLGFPGQFRIHPISLKYNLTRFYSSETGSYWQSDTIGLQGGVNLFQYANGNPHRNIDNLGTSWYPHNSRTQENTIECRNGSVRPRLALNFDKKNCAESYDRLLSSGRMGKRHRSSCCDEVARCYLVHESSHADDVLASGGGNTICKDRPDGWSLLNRDPVDRMRSECRAHRAGMACFQAAAAKDNCPCERVLTGLQEREQKRAECVCNLAESYSNLVGPIYRRSARMDQDRCTKML